jgi:hypothetical protein
MTKAELIRRMAVGTRWRTIYLPSGREVPERAVQRHQSNGAWFTPAPGKDQSGFLDWPKASCIREDEDGAITLTFESGVPFARYYELS